MLIEVKRFSNHTKHGTLSEVYIDGELFCYGLEQDWEGDIPEKSCIPTGKYKLEWFDSPKYGKVLSFVNPDLGVTQYKDDTVKHPYYGYNRYACLIHPANYAYQLKGCLALGKKVTTFDNSYIGVTSSRNTIKEFYNLVENEIDLEAHISTICNF